MGPQVNQSMIQEMFSRLDLKLLLFKTDFIFLFCIAITYYFLYEFFFIFIAIYNVFNSFVTKFFKEFDSFESEEFGSCRHKSQLEQYLDEQRVDRIADIDVLEY